MWIRIYSNGDLDLFESGPGYIKIWIRFYSSLDPDIFDNGLDPYSNVDPDP